MEDYSCVLCPGNVSPAVRCPGPSSADAGWPCGGHQRDGTVLHERVDIPSDMWEETLSDPEIAAVAVKLVDFNAEATAEKATMLRLLDGRISAVLGTHRTSIRPMRA